MPMDRTWCLGILFISAGLFGVDLRTVDTRVEFRARATGGIKVNGRCDNGVSGTDKEAYLDANCFKTGLGLRDRHLRELLRSDKYPLIKLKFNVVGDAFSGILTLRGVSKPVSGAAKASPLKLNFTIKLSTFDIERPSYLGVGVKDEVQIEAKIK